MKSLIISTCITLLYCSTLSILLYFYYNQLKESDNYESDNIHTNNGINILITCIASILSTLLFFIIQLSRLITKKKLFDVPLSCWENIVWVIIGISTCVLFITSLVSFVINCSFEYIYSCHGFHTPLYISVLIPIYIFTISIIAISISRCCGYKIKKFMWFNCQELSFDLV
jgi:hypothetical protein